MAYNYGDYSLYTREVTLKNSNAVQRIYYFARSTPKSGVPCDLPKGYEVGVNPRTGMPYVKKGEQTAETTTRRAGFLQRWFN